MATTHNIALQGAASTSGRAASALAARGHYARSLARRWAHWRSVQPQRRRSSSRTAAEGLRDEAPPPASASGGFPGLRDYQVAAKEAVLEAWGTDCRRRLLLVLPTGRRFCSCGKTVIFSSIAEHFLQQGQRAMVLAHRRELLHQAGGTMSWMFSGRYKIQEERAEHWAEADADVVLASVPTLGREGSSRRFRFSPADFGLLLIDEAHHAPASTYQSLVDYFTHANPSLLVLGVTATKERTDKKMMGGVFRDGIVYERTMLEMQRAGWLAPTICYQVTSATDLDAVPTLRGDYSLRQLTEAVNTVERNELVVRSYVGKFLGQQALVFCCGLEHVASLVGQFASAGVAAAAVMGSTPGEDRKDILRRFKSGDIQVVCNYGVLTEGFDYPALGVIIQARPTQSALLLTQIVGRANRLHPGKRAAQVVEIMDLKGERAVTVPQLFGFPQHFACEGHDLLECSDVAEQLVGDAGRCVDEYRGRNRGPYSCRSWHSLRAFQWEQHQEEEEEGGGAAAGEVSGRRTGKEPRAAWDEAPVDGLGAFEGLDGLVDEVIYPFHEVEHPAAETLLFANVRQGQRPLCGVFVLREIGEDAYRVVAVAPSGRNARGSAVVRSHELDTEEQALHLGCAYIKRTFPYMHHLLNLSGKWRDDGCTDKQYSRLVSWGLLWDGVTQHQLTKGNVSDLISGHLIQRDLEDYREGLDGIFQLRVSPSGRV
eukprot:jgi/Tetstr1/463803/TSEL_008618.t1